MERAAEGAEGDPEAQETSYFEDDDFMCAIESLRSTPEERAERKKGEGNDHLRSSKRGGLQKAIEAYTDGLDEQPRDVPIKAALLSNRAAAQLMLKNWGKALADASAALELGALPIGAQLKCCRRGAAAAVRLGKLEKARAMLEQGQSLEGGSTIPS